jgi:hypothetical protein
MKTLLILALLALPNAAHPAAFSVNINVLTIHSQNGRFYLRSIPFDDELATMRGVTRVYATGQSAPLYEFERGFDSVYRGSNNLILSDDGETILYVLPSWADEEREGLKSVTLYRHGRILRSYTETEVNGCDRQRERCSLVYSNDATVIDREKSGMFPNYKRVFKDGISEEEIFLNDFAIFGNGDTVYLTDSNKRTHRFDLKQGVLAGSDSFDDLYGTLKGLARFTQVELESYEDDWFDGFPRLKGGGKTSKALARFLGMKEFDLDKSSDWNQYKRYEVTVRSNLLRDGSVEVEEVKVDDGLPRDRIIEFFKAGRFEIGNLPAVFDKWHLGAHGEETFYFRKSDKRLARNERQAELAEEERLERGASAVLHEDKLIHLDESGRVRAWRLADGSFDAATTARLSRDDLTRLASDGEQLWALGASRVHRWSSQDQGWKTAAGFDQKRQPVKGFALAGGVPLLVLATGVVNPVTKRRYATPGDDALELMKMDAQFWVGPDTDGSERRLFPERYNPRRIDFSPLSRTVAVLGTQSQLWIGTSGGEWGGSLRGLDPATGRWAEYGDSLHYVTGMTQDGSGDVIVSWSMSHFDADTMIRRHGPDAVASQDYPELDEKYYQTVAFNPFDSTLYGVEQRDIVTISEGMPTRIAELEGRVFGKEAMALGVAPGIGSLLPFAPGSLIVVPKIGMPWLLSDGKLTRLTEP